jgi:hypothetical protein
MLMMMVDSVRETGCKVGGECFWVFGCGDDADSLGFYEVGGED